MNRITNVTVVNSLHNSTYVRPFTMHFTQNGSEKTWDLFIIHDTVAIVIYNVTRDVLILVKQFRPAVYYASIPEEDRKLNRKIDVKKYPPEIGITIELCAGIVDKKMTPSQIAKEEILEECGYDVPESSLENIGSYYSGSRTNGNLRTTFYCEVTDRMRVSRGGGVGDEVIDVIEMTVDEVKKYMCHNNIKSPLGFMYGIYWFLFNKVNK